MRHFIHSVASSFLFLCLFAFASWAQTAHNPSTPDVPRTISYQAALSDASGKPLPDGDYIIGAALYSENGAHAIWHDNYRVHVERGIVNLALGSGAIPFPDISSVGAVWLGLRINGSEELPLSQFTAVPYALTVPNGAITSSKLADNAVTAEKMGTDYVSSFSVNGQKISGKATDINLVTGDGITAALDPATNSIVLKSAPSGILDNKGAAVQSPLTVFGTLTVTSSTFFNTTGGTTTIASLDASKPVKTDANKILVSGAIDLASSNDVMGSLSIANGGTGATTTAGASTNILPSQSGNSGKVLTTNGAGSLSWLTPYTGLVHFTESYDNTNYTEATNSIRPIAGVNSVGSEPDIDIMIVPKREGALQTTVSDGSIVGGDKRGLAATDWQRLRNSSAEVASGTYAVIGGGTGNIANNIYATVAGGGTNAAGNEYATVGGGTLNRVTGVTSTIGGGVSNNVSGTRSVIPGGGALTLTGDGSFGFLGFTLLGDGVNARSMRVDADNTSVFGNTDLWLADNDGMARSMYFFAPYTATTNTGSYPTSGNVKYTAFKAGQQTTSVTYTLPLADGSSRDVLSTAGDGTLSWASPNEVTGNLIPMVADAYDLGSPEFPWGNGYFDPITFVSAAPSYWNVGAQTTGGVVNRLSFGYNSSTPGPYTELMSLSPAGALDIQNGEIRTNGVRAILMQSTGPMTAPNLTEGYSGNSITAGVLGGTIGGGGESTLANRVADDYGTVGGGAGNVAGNNSGSTSDAYFATVGGGFSNTAGGVYNTVGGGYGNMATDNFATISGGAENRAPGVSSTVSGGIGNYAIGWRSAIVGGASLIVGDQSFGFNGNDLPAIVPQIPPQTNISAFPFSAYFGNVDLWIGNTKNSAKQLRFYEPNSSFTYTGTNYTAFQAQTQAATISYSLPASQPNLNDVLTATSLSGTGPYQATLSWSTPSPASATAWALVGNSGTTTATNFVGTTDNAPLEIHVNETGSASEGRKRVMRFEPNALSANIIGGHNSNSVASGKTGATISGGGSAAFPNKVGLDGGTVGGGRGNTAGVYSPDLDNFGATVSGGYSNTASQQLSTIGGGSNNQAIADHSVISGGDHNLVCCTFGSIGGGYRNSDGEFSAIPGGMDLTLSGYSFGYNVPYLNEVTDLNWNQFFRVAYFGNVDLWIGNTGNASHALRFYEPNTSTTYTGTNYSAFKAQSQSDDIIYTLPATQPNENDVLTASSVTGTGPYEATLSWLSPVPASSTAWALSGNNISASPTEFLGTTSNNALAFKTNSVPGMTLTAPVNATTGGALNLEGPTTDITGYQIAGVTVMHNTGTENMFVGDASGAINSNQFGFGRDNAFFGFHSGYANTDGEYNTFAGALAGELNGSGYHNTFVGYATGHDNTNGAYNSFFGDGAGYHTTIVMVDGSGGFAGGGSYNLFSGVYAGYLNTTGAFNSYLGSQAGQNNSAGSFNTYVGSGAGFLVTSESNSTLVGTASEGAQNLTNATAIGYQSYVSQSNSLVLGSIANVNNTWNTSEDTKVGIGTTAPVEKFEVKNGNILLSNSGGTAYELQFKGTGSGLSTFEAGAQGTTSIHYTLPTSLPGTNDVLKATTISGSDVTLNWSASAAAPSGWNLDGNANTNPGTDFVGTTDASDLIFKTNGTEDVRIINGVGFVGIGTSSPGSKLDVAGSINVSTGSRYEIGQSPILASPGWSSFFGFTNLSVGVGAGLSGSSIFNTFSGGNAGNSNSTGSGNVFSGFDAGFDNTTGATNTFIGLSAGTANTAGGGNVALGSGADFGHSDLTNATAIGAHALVSTVNSLVLGSIANQNGADADADTKVGIGTSTPAQKLEVMNGNVLLSNTGEPKQLQLQGSGTGMTTFQAGSQGTTSINYTLPASLPSVHDVLTATVVSGSAVTLDWTAGSGAGWGVHGNTGTIAGTYFLGTTDPQDFVIKTDNTERVRVLSGGSVGIGTPTPAQSLDVAGRVRVENLPTSTDNSVVTANAAGDLSLRSVAGLINSGDFIQNRITQQPNSNFFISGSGVIGQNLTVAQNATIAGTLAVVGVTTVSSDILPSHSGINLGSLLQPFDNLYLDPLTLVSSGGDTWEVRVGFGGELQFNSLGSTMFSLSNSGVPSEFEGSLNIVGQTSTSGLVNIGSFSNAGNVLLTGALEVFGPTALSTISTTGLATLNSMAIVNDASIGGIVTVGNSISTPTLIAGTGGVHLIGPPPDTGTQPADWSMTIDNSQGDTKTCISLARDRTGRSTALKVDETGNLTVGAHITEIIGGQSGIQTHANTATRTYTWPDKNGTVAMLSDLIPAGEVSVNLIPTIPDSFSLGSVARPFKEAFIGGANGIHFLNPDSIGPGNSDSGWAIQNMKGILRWSRPTPMLMPRPPGYGMSLSKEGDLLVAGIIQSVGGGIQLANPDSVGTANPDSGWWSIANAQDVLRIKGGRRHVGGTGGAGLALTADGDLTVDNSVTSPTLTAGIGGVHLTGPPPDSGTAPDTWSVAVSATDDSKPLEFKSVASGTTVATLFQTGQLALSGEIDATTAMLQGPLQTGVFDGQQGAILFVANDAYGTLTAPSLSDYQTWTLPDQSGAILVSGGTLNGSSYTPTGTSDTAGVVGDITYGSNYIYVKTTLGWERSELHTW